MKFLSIRYILFRLIHAVLCLVLVIQVNGQRKVLYASNPPEGFAASRIARQALKDDMRYWQQVLEIVARVAEALPHRSPGYLRIHAGSLRASLRAPQ